MGNIADPTGLEKPSMKGMDMPSMDSPDGMKMPTAPTAEGMAAMEDMAAEALEALGGMEALENMADFAAMADLAATEAAETEAVSPEIELASAPDSGCTEAIGTHTVHNTAGDANEPWLNLRASSKSDSDVLTRMPDGTCLTVLSQDSSFWNVQIAGGSMNGITGYAHKNYMKALEKAPAPEAAAPEAAAPEAAAPEAAAPEAAAPEAAAPEAAAPEAAAAEPRTGRVKVRSKPGANARIYVDGAARGSAPSTLTLDEGSHRIKLVGKSGKEKTFNVRVNPSSPSSICWNFKKKKNCGN